MHPPNALKALDRSHPRYPSPDKNPERGSLEKDQLAFKIDPTACGQARRHGCAHRSRLSPQADVRIDPLFTMSDNTRPSCGFDRRATDAEFKCSGRATTPTGGARRDRTDDLLLAKQALSQLSYGPLNGIGSRQPARSADASGDRPRLA